MASPLTGEVIAALQPMMRLLCLLSISCLSAKSQWLSLGVTGAVPISPHSVNYGPASIVVGQSATTTHYIEAPNEFYQKPYSVGPTVDFNLPWHVSLEAGMLYERFHKDESQGVSMRPPFSFGFIRSVAANAFAFPLLGKYNFGYRGLRAFAGGGATLRHLSSFEGKGIQIDPRLGGLGLYGTPADFEFDSGKAIDVAITATAGLRYRLGAIDLLPEIRYLHWTAAYEQPRAGSSDVLSVDRVSAASLELSPPRSRTRRGLMGRGRAAATTRVSFGDPAPGGSFRSPSQIEPNRHVRPALFCDELADSIAAHSRLLCRS
jgi:hypothetical protein